MSYLRCILVSVAFVAWVVACAAAQQSLLAASAAQQSASAPAVSVDEAFIHKEFGEEFSLLPMSTPFVRDVDGDGVDDFVIVAKSKKPMLDAAEHSYRVIDPYYDFFGYGDPKLTASFGAEDLMEKNLVVLVIHGAGAEAWRAEKPKAKYVIINLPFAVQPIQRAFEAIPRNVREAAFVSGLSRMATTRYVELPLAWPGIISAIALVVAHTLGEFGVILMIGGSIPGETRVLSISIYDRVQAYRSEDAAIMSAALLAFSLVAIALVHVLARVRR